MRVGRDGDGLPIVQYWHSEQVPAEIAELTGTFRELNPDLDHRVFCERTADEFIGRHFSPREQAAFLSCAVPAMQSDYFRYCAVLALGGIYADADFLCLRSLRSLIDTTEDGLVLRRDPDGHLINGFFLFREPGSPLLRLALDVATANIEQRAAQKVNAVTGPWVFSALAAVHRAESLDLAQKDGVGPAMKRLQSVAAETVGSAARVAAAFDGVRIESLDHAWTWIAYPSSPLRYKQEENHWVNWNRSDRSIFR